MPQQSSPTLGLYIHIPFCLRKCNYCDFCSFPGRDGAQMTAYTRELCRRLTLWAPRCAEYPVDTLYFGGGTPTLLPLACFEALFDTLGRHYRLTEDCEITCECNPATADRAYLTALRGLGVNRLSVGLQSADDRELTLLGRAHSFADFRALFADARAAGFDNLSADLMYGLPDQTAEGFRQSLRALIDLSPEHVSAYGLKIEEGTPFARRRPSLALPDEDTEYEMYTACTELLGEAGYQKYEISNFARPGRESRHNLRYWERRDYLGLGVAAHSCFEGVRFGNGRDMDAFLAGADITVERAELDETDAFNEYLMLGLRLTKGIDTADFRARFGIELRDAYPHLNDLLRHGFMTLREGRLAFTDRGFFVSNTVLSGLLRS